MRSRINKLAWDNQSSVTVNGHEPAGGDHQMSGIMDGGMGMITMAHPIHRHGQYFQILSRSIPNDESTDYAMVKDGFVDAGWKDTVLLMPGGRIRLLKPFENFKGLFICHTPEREDMGMMRDFSVE